MRSSKTTAGRPSPRHDRGASLVEFAVLAPLLFSILLGIITGGFALATKNSMTNAVREGARVGATLPEGTGWNADWAVDVKDRVVDLAGGDLEDDEVCVQLIDASDGSLVGRYPSGGCPASMPSAPSTPGSATSGCIVKVWAQSEATLNALFFSRDLDLEAQSVGIYERDECPT